MTFDATPRILPTVTLLTDEQILDESFVADRSEQVFFCGYGHDFVLSFATEEEAEAAVVAECPVCTALAPTFPQAEADPVITAPDLSNIAPVTHLACLRTTRLVRESLAEHARRDLAISAA
jgi:hypothetical protein